MISGSAEIIRPRRDVLRERPGFAAWLGLLPRQHSTGGKLRLLGLSTRGDRYLRQLLVHGAWATLCWVKRKHDRRSQWVPYI
jgi:transposase